MTISVRLAALAAAVALATPWPAAADTYPRQLGVDIQHYVFRLTLTDASDEIQGDATVDVRFVQSGVAAFELDLVNAAGRTDGRGMTVTGVTSDGAPVAFTHAGDRLRLMLAAPPETGAQRRFRIAYHGTPATGLLIGPNRHGDRTFFSDDWPDKARNWLPTIDHVSDKATCEFLVTAPARYQVVSKVGPDGRHVRQAVTRRLVWGEAPRPRPRTARPARSGAGQRGWPRSSTWATGAQVRDLCHPPLWAKRAGGWGEAPRPRPRTARPARSGAGQRGWPRSTTWATGAQVRDLGHPPLWGEASGGVGEAPPKEESPDASRAPGDDGVVGSVATVGGAKNPRRLWTEARCFGRPTRGLVANPPPFLKPAGHERTRGRLPQEPAASVRTARPWLDRLQTAPPTERSDWPRRTPRG